jgi:DUF4097 and DUF4098 domain-containing protein YvlB
MQKLIIIFLAVVTSIAHGQTFTEKIQKEFSFAKKSPENTVMVININGSVQIKGYRGDKIIVEAEKIIRGKTNEILDKAKEKITVGYKDLSDTLIFYVEGLCYKFGKNNENHRKQNGNWGYNWNNCRDQDGWVKDESYDYEFNFVVQVPEEVNVVVSTVNKGDIEGLNVSGIVVANNVNGSITLNHLKNRTVARTVNGDVDLSYDVNPAGNCQFYTLNGDINADFSPGLAANVSFESFNGAFFTNLDEMELLPVTMEKIENKPGVKYRIKGNKYKVGHGGANLDFETFNGNVYLKETRKH